MIEFQSVFECFDHYFQFDLLILENTTVRYSMLLSWPSFSSYFWVNRCVTVSQYVAHNFRSSTGMLTRGPGFKSQLRFDFPPPVTLCYYECFGLSKSCALKLMILKITFKSANYNLYFLAGMAEVFVAGIAARLPQSENIDVSILGN